MNTPANQLTGHVCPQCGKALEIPMAVMNNCMKFHAKTIFRARCCGYGVRIVPQFTFELEPVARNTVRDTFGVSLEQQPKE